MGIKGIYKEIGPGDRISLCKLAVDTLETTGRPLRLAIDFSIWQFQVQAAKGGANPAIRTLFYRLVRLLGLAIHPIFVFDGPHKPTFKRNKRSSGRGDVVATAMGKRLIRLFGFTIHDAPGEAEAECALLQQQGIVDAVLSEDVDTIMFGCRKTLRNWSAEGTKGSKTPTHVSVYDAGAMVAGSSGLDREGMVLVALMSGGDYLPEGVPGCGVKVACEAARAGFGRELCRIKRADRNGLAAWKGKLLHELRTNESGFFRTRHKALEIPETFPNMEILRYYTHPVVSQEGTVERLKSEFPPASTVDIVGLREFSRETFDWDFKIGAVKFIRVLAPSLLVQQFLERYVSPESHHDDLNLKEKEESALVRAISSKRAHFSTDATPELRISFVPANIVKLDLDREPEEEVKAFGRSGIALNSDDEFDEEAEELDAEQPKSSSVRKPFDPLQPELIWIPETLAKLGIPLAVEDWEGKQRLKEQRVAAKGTRKTRAKKTDMPAGALDKYVKVTKNAADSATKAAPRLELASSPPRIGSQCGPPAPKGRSKQSKKTSTSSQAKPPADVNPWTLASSHASPRAPRPLPPPASQTQPKHSSASDPIILSSSPAAPASPAPRSASVRRGQTTPTRPKWASPPVEDVPSPAPLFSPSPSPRKQRFPVPDEPAKEESCATEVQPRKARPFKRVKSGAADTAKVSTTQQSIKSFGRVMKSTASSRINTKGAVPDTQPIEILSDDEEFALPLLKQASASVPKVFRQRTVSPPRDRFGFVSDDDPFASPPPVQARAAPKASTGAPVRAAPPSRVDSGTISDDDPFASPPPVRRRTPIPELPANAPASPTNTNRGQKGVVDGSDTTKDDPTTTTTAKTATVKPATTKLYLPRTSLDGLGYFKEIEVRRDDADRVLAEHNRSDIEKGKGQSRRAWRRSEIQVFDLTGED